MDKKIDFVIGFDGLLESYEVTEGEMSEDDLQDTINTLVNLDVLYLGERTSGRLKMTKKLIKVWFKVYTEPDYSEYDNYKNEIETDKIYS